MIELDDTKIKTIADELDSGFTCYVHKDTGNLISIPNESNHDEMDLDAWKDDIRKIKSARKSYYIIEPLDSSENFEIMKSFAEIEVKSPAIQERLVNALSHKHPFRQFKYEIDNSGEWRKKWFNFKTKELKEYVRGKLE